MTRVHDVDEFELIRRFREVLPAGERALVASGDDCAVIAAPEGQFIVSTDVLVENHDFLRHWSSAYEVGARAAAQNLADIAAMGGRVSTAVVGLTIPEDEDLEWVIDLVRGFGDRIRTAGGGVDGGDLSAGEQVVVSVTVMGWTDGPAVTRCGARVGDVVALAGTLGRSGAGLDLLMGGFIDPTHHSEDELGDVYEAVRIFRSPEPPLEAGPAALRAGATAMMDLSDGLAKDANRLARASGVRIEIDRELLTADLEALSGPALVVGKNPMEWVLRGGEDHSLLATFPADSPLPEGFRVIGRVCEAHDGHCGAFVDGQQLHGGWDHFKRD